MNLKDIDWELLDQADLYQLYIQDQKEEIAKEIEEILKEERLEGGESSV